MGLATLDLSGIFAPPAPTGFGGNNPFGFGFVQNMNFPLFDFNSINNMKFNFMTSFAWTPSLGTSTLSTNTSNYINTPLTFNVPPIQYNSPLFNNNISLDCVDTFQSTTKPNLSTGHSLKNSKKNYQYLTKAEALAKAASDKNLEKLSGGNGWSISTASFINDIPYAKKGVSKLLDKVCELTGETLVITSALGTKDSPHAKGSSSASHYNANNPKLDFGGNLTHAQAVALKKKLDNTGLFAWLKIEDHNGTSHLDAQFAESAFKTV